MLLPICKERTAIDSIVKIPLLKSVKCIVLSPMLFLYRGHGWWSYFIGVIFHMKLFYWCNVLQFDATWVKAPTREDANRVDVSLTYQFGGCLILHPILCLCVPWYVSLADIWSSFWVYPQCVGLMDVWSSFWVCSQCVNLADVWSSIQSSVWVHAFYASLVAYVGLALLPHVMHLMFSLHKGTPGNSLMSVPRGS